MKVYEESVGDRLARLKGGKLQLSVVLRLCSWGHISSYQSYNVDLKKKGNLRILVFTGTQLS